MWNPGFTPDQGSASWPWMIRRELLNYTSYIINMEIISIKQFSTVRIHVLQSVQFKRMDWKLHM